MSDIDRDESLRLEDAAARAEARSTFDAPMLLEAGAGTGKTTTLIARLVTWSLGPGWERAELDAESADAPAIARTVLDGIVAITFTEAAAADMGRKLERAYHTLAAGAVPQGCGAEDLPADIALRASRALALARTLDRPVVHTIHAFCRGLLADHPFEAGLAPSFAVDADGSALDGVVREVLESELAARLAAEPDPEIARLLSRRVGPRRIQEALAQLASGGWRASDLEPDPYAPDRAAALVDALGERVRALLTGPGVSLAGVSTRAKVTLALLADLHATLELLPDARPLTIDVLDDATERLRAQWSDGTRKRLREWAAGTINTLEAKCLGDEAHALQTLAEPLAPLVDTFCRMEPLLHDSARRTLSALLDRVRTELVSRGIETYSDLLRDAQRLVLEHPRVVRALRARMRQLVVDEFQDTDPLQCDLIRRIALDDIKGAPRPGLFLVGDPKQSIYGWRSADLAAYEAFAKEIEQHGGVRTRLSVNFRSTRRILAEVERAMLPIMHASAGLQPAFQPLVAARDELGAPVERIAPWIQDPALDEAFGGTTSEAARTIEADWIAMDLAEQHARDVPWRDMAILLRSTGALDTYLGALRARGVPYEVAGDKSYYQRREIVEAAALVRTVVDPRDHVALVALLRSSLVGVPDAALIPLWRHRFHEHMTEITGPGGSPFQAALDALAAALPEIPRDVPGIERIAGFEVSLLAAVQSIARLRQSLATEPADVFVEELRTLFLVEARAAALYLGPYRVSNLERFFRRLAEELDQRGADAQSCLRALRAARSQAREAEEARPKDAALDAVQVMTIHKSKGLDFAHVYVADLHRSSRRSQPPTCEVAGRDGRTSYAFFGSPTPGYEEVQAARASVEAAERVRTLYVAMTRARERLVLTGRLPHDLRVKPWDACATHMELLASSMAPDLLAQLFAVHMQGSSTLESDGTVWVLPAWPRPALSSTVPQPVDAAEDVRAVERSLAIASARTAAATHMLRPWSSAASGAHERASKPDSSVRSEASGVSRNEASDASAIGRAMHKVLESLAGARGHAQSAHLRSELERHLVRELEGAPSSKALARATEIFERFVAGPLYEKLVALQSDVLARELPVLLPPAREDSATGFVSGTIDLVYLDHASDEIVIADYKTDAAASESASERYAAQGRAYVRAVRAALELDRDPRFELWFVAQDRIEVVA